VAALVGRLWGRFGGPLWWAALVSRFGGGRLYGRFGGRSGEPLWWPLW